MSCQAAPDIPQMDSTLAHGEIVEGSPVNGCQHLPSFYCPISKRCMHDPVVLSDGHTYERRHIERWLEQHGLSPVSGLQLLSKTVFPNHALRNAIEEYFQQVFSVHRQAIRSSVGAAEAPRSLGSNASLLRTIDSLMQCSLLVNADLSTECVLRRIVDEAKLLLGAEVASVFLVDAEQRELFSTVNSTGRELRIPVTAGIAGHVATSGESVIVRDAYGDARFSRIVDAKTGFKTRNMMCAPLKVKKGGIIGVVQLINKAQASLFADGRAEDSFTPDDLQFLQVFASQAATAIAGSGILDDPPSPVLKSRNSRSKELCRWAKDLVRWLASPGQEGPKSCVEKAGFRGADTSKEDPEVIEEGVPEVEVEAAVDASFPNEPKGIWKRAVASPHGSIPAMGIMHAKTRGLAKAFDSWELDAFALAEETGNKPLSTLGAYVFDRLGLVAHFNIDPEKLLCFLEEIERGYDDANAYHNRIHAASVLHAMHALLEHGGLAKLVAPAVICDVAAEDGEQLVRMACLMAAAVHDFEHRGLSNDFLVRTSDEWAVCYNDQHVNEQHHVAAAFAVLRRPECNFLARLPPSQFKWLRRLVVDLVIATDMASNGTILQSLTEVIDAFAAKQDVKNAAGTDVGVGGAPDKFAPATVAEATMVLQVAMKCADLGHLAVDWEVHTRWVGCLEREFFAQGDCEKALGMDVSFLMDRDKPGASETQVGFFQYVVLPLFRTLSRAAPQADAVLLKATSNYGHWQDVQSSKDGVAAGGP